MKFTTITIGMKTKQFVQDESGSTAIEYGLMASLIGLLAVTGASSLGGDINNKFVEISGLFSSPTEPATAADPGPP